MDQLFTEEQFEVYRALGEHIGRRLVGGEDAPSVKAASKGWLIQHIKELIPEINLYPPARPDAPGQPELPLGRARSLNRTRPRKTTIPKPHPRSDETSDA